MLKPLLVHVSLNIIFITFLLTCISLQAKFLSNFYKLDINLRFMFSILSELSSKLLNSVNLNNSSSNTIQQCMLLYLLKSENISCCFSL